MLLLRRFFRKEFVLVVVFAIFFARPADGQVSMGSGSYSQNFDSLASASAAWTNNVTLPGWYASKGSADSTNYLGGSGTSSTGGLYSFGTNGVNPATDRALGSLASGSATPVALGIRFVNNTPFAQTNITISYAGEQWRNGSSTVAQTNVFSYAVSNSPITNSFLGSWINFIPLNFVSPVVIATSVPLDGNIATNRQVFTNVVLAGVTLQPGQELFLRWLDSDAPGFDDGLAIDDLTVTFTTNAVAAATPPTITSQPQDQSATAGDTVTFIVVADGTAPLSYQWQSNNVSVAGATNDTFTLFNVTTNLNGSTYSVAVTNMAGSTNSQIATLTVNPSTTAFTYMTYNVHGNGVADWSTNTAQAQAIGREIKYLNPDIITFNEIPHTNVWQMTNWVTAFMPGYNLATNSGSDNFINSVIASRFPIARSQKWLDGVSLAAFGYSGNFTRDLFEAEVVVPGFPQHLHVFVTHLKATTSGGQADADKRAAEASCVSNFFVNTFLAGTNFLHPYILSGDMNESALFPETNVYNSGHPIQRLTSAPTGLQYTDPLNSITHTDLTESIQGPASALDTRFDYIFPSTVMFSNIASSQVFRTDLLTNFPSNLFSNDDKIASDHLPVLMTFNNPFFKPFRLTSITRSNLASTLQWESVPGQPYTLESSTNLTAAWTALATNLTATNYTSTFTTNHAAGTEFFRIRSP